MLASFFFIIGDFFRLGGAWLFISVCLFFIYTGDTLRSGLLIDLVLDYFFLPGI